MPFSLMHFIGLLATKDTSFKKLSRIKNSSMDPLIALLPVGGVTTVLHTPKITETIAYIPYDKQMKYKDALEYLRTQLNLREIQQIPFAIPVQPTMKMDEFYTLSRSYPGGPLLDPGTYIHVFKITYKSSNGNMASLTRVGTRENVTFTSDPAGAPFNYVQANTPRHFVQGATTNSGANLGFAKDDHSTIIPSVICAWPRVTGELVAEQLYEYTTDGINWHTIPGAAYLIKKGVRASGNGHVFYFAKTNWMPQNNKVYRFEVEYPIGAPPAVMPPSGVNLQKGGKIQNNIADYGRVISAG